MKTSSLFTSIDSNFIERFKNLASGATKTKPGSAGPSDEQNIITGLRAGAKGFAASIQRVNQTISAVNIAESTLGGLQKAATEMVDLAAKAASRATGQLDRRKIEAKIQKLAHDFQNAVKDTKFKDTELLSPEGLREVFQAVGIDPDQSEILKKAFSRITHLPGSTHSDKSTTGASSTETSDSASKTDSTSTTAADPGAGDTSAPATKDLLSSEIKILSHEDAQKLLKNLSELKEKLDGNVDALKDSRAALVDLTGLARETGLAMLDLSQNLNSTDASDLARSLREAIRRNANQSMQAQASNLEPLVVAALTASAPTNSQA